MHTVAIANPLTTEELRDHTEDAYSQLVEGADWDATLRNLEHHHPGLSTSSCLAAAHHVHLVLEEVPYLADWAVALAEHQMSTLRPDVWDTAAVQIAVAQPGLADPLVAAVREAVDRVLSQHVAAHK